MDSRRSLSFLIPKKMLLGFIPFGVIFDEIKDSPKDSPWNELWVLPEDTLVEELGSVEDIELNMVISAEFVE